MYDWHTPLSEWPKGDGPLDAATDADSPWSWLAAAPLYASEQQTLFLHLLSLQHASVMLSTQICHSLGMLTYLRNSKASMHVNTLLAMINELVGVKDVKASVAIRC